MAVTRYGQVILMTANADAVTDKLFVQGLHATGAVAGITDTAGNPVGAFTAEAGVSLDCPLKIEGLKRGAGAGHLYVYLK
jgi:hypothetical protein